MQIVINILGLIFFIALVIYLRCFVPFDLKKEKKRFY